MRKPKVIVVGGGLAGLMACIRLAEADVQVDLFSLVPAKRSHSVCAQGGINGAVNTRGEGDSPWQHFDDTVYGGDFLADQPPVKAMCEAAPGVIHLLDRMGVMFNRTSEGLLDFRRFGGTQHHRTAYAGATTGQQMIYALDEQVRRHEVDGRIRRFEFWEFLSNVMDKDGRVRGITAMNLKTMEVDAYRADAVLLATGGPGMIFGRTTNSMTNTGGAVGMSYRQGARYANPEFIQVHPTAIRGEDKCRLMSESARGEGGRVWVYKDGKPWYFLEEWYPAYGNLVPRDIATRAIHKVVYELGLGIDGEPVVHLDLTHKDAGELDRKLGGILEIYEKFMGEDPRKVPMKVFPAVHYSMGGIWVDFNQATNLPGLFAAGECEHAYHGANRLGANSLLSCTYGGQVAAASIQEYLKGLPGGQAEDLDAGTYNEALKREQAANETLLKRTAGKENPYRLHDELGQVMNANVTVVRHNDKIDEADVKIGELMERYKDVNVVDSSRWVNQALPFARQLETMLILARVIARAARARDESRGAHYKPAFDKRDDAKWLKTTVAEHGEDGPRFRYEDVDTSLIKPRPRKYDVVSSTAGAKA